MVYERRLLPSDVAGLRTLADYTIQGGSRTRDWTNVNRMLEFATKYGWIMRTLSRGDWARYTTGSADTVVRYFNDAVTFVKTGKRIISIVGWDVIIRESIARDFYGKREASRAQGNIGSLVIAAANVDHPIVTKQLTANNCAIDRALLDYIDKDIILMWSMRQNGLEDMIITLARLAEVVYALQNNDDDDDD